MLPLDALLALKKKVPGVAQYKTEDLFKKVTIGPPSLKMRRQ